MRLAGSPCRPARPAVASTLCLEAQAAMTGISAQPMKSAAMAMEDHSPGVLLRSIIIGLTAFLTVVDLFATQAILPSLARHYQVAPAAMGFAVNATTMGMAVAGLVVALFQPAYRPAARHSHQPHRAGDPDQPVGLSAQSYDLHPAADRPGSVHGVGLCVDTRLSRRTMQRHRRRRRVRGLHHRKCGK